MGATSLDGGCQDAAFVIDGARYRSLGLETTTCLIGGLGRFDHQGRRTTLEGPLGGTRGLDIFEGPMERLGRCTV